MLRQSATTPFEQFRKAESRLIQRLGSGADDRIFELSTWEAADSDLLGLFPAISSALSVLGDEESQQQQQPGPQRRRSVADSRDSTRQSSLSCSLTGACASSSDSSSGAPSRASSTSSASSPRSSGSSSPGAGAAVQPQPNQARWCRPGLKDLQLLVSKEDVSSIPRASSIEEVLALLSKDDVIAVPTHHGGVILYEVTYLDDLATQQPPTVIPPSPDDPATQLSPEVFNFFLQNEELLNKCQDSALMQPLLKGGGELRAGRRPSACFAK